MKNEIVVGCDSGHKASLKALEKLMEAAKKEKKMEHARFAVRLMLHAQTEE